VNWLTLAFDRPLWLLLLLTLPLVVWMSRHSLAAMGRGRRIMAVALRCGVLTLMVFALAEIQLVRVTQRIAAYFLLDQSLSLTTDQRREAVGYVAAATAAHQNHSLGDTAGVIVFGSEAQVERPLSPLSQPAMEMEAAIDGNRTNLADAMRLARATMPSDVARRIVVVSDGNQNVGDALAEARRLAEAGIGIDVAPLPFLAQADVRIEKINVPGVARAGAPFDVSIVLEHVQPPHASSDQPVSGRLVVLRKAGGRSSLVADEAVSLPPGKTVLTFREELNEAAFYSYEARFTADRPEQDRITQNNQATAFTNLQGRGQVLMIVNSESPAEFDELVATLRKNDMEVTVQTTDSLFTSLAELQQYDSIVLANVPRVSGNAADALSIFTDEQVRMLVQCVEKFGAGLVMIGGPDSLGAGGWANTELERAMPVDFSVKNAKVAAVGALMLVIDKSGSMDGEKLKMSKAAAQAAVDMLGSLDQIGVIAFDGDAEEVVRLQRVGGQPHQVKSRISRLASGGGTNMEPGVRRGYAALERSEASVKHMIVLTDGQTQGSGYAQLAAQMRKKNITTTTVAIGTDAARGLLQDIATRGGGKYYQVNNPRVLPRIFSRETRRVVRPLIFEDEKGFQPSMVGSHEVLRGIDGPLPPLTGFVLTTTKDSPLVETPILAPKPGATNNSILATWTYGLGHTAVFTSDAGQRWTKDWPAWPQQEQLFVQLVRWSMRPLGDQGSFSVATDVKDGRLRAVVTAMTKDGEFLNNLPMQAVVAGEGGEQSQPLEFKQEAPGRYVAETTLAAAGSYLIGISPGRGHGLLRTGVNVPYSAEFKDHAANEELMLQLASISPPGGKPGEIIRLPDDPKQWRRFAGPDVFRRDLPPGRALSALWPLAVLLGAGLFFLDVAHRRVGVALPPLRTMAQRLFMRKAAEAESQADARLARLRSTKSATQALAASRYASNEPEGEVELASLTEVVETPPRPERFPRPPAPEREETPSDESSYSQRLLDVKRSLRNKSK